MNQWTPRVYLTLRCDLACWYCSNGGDIRWTRADELDAAGWLEVLTRLPGNDVVFTGGEPTLHGDFLKVVEYAEHCGKVMNIYSNFARDFDVPPGLNIHWRASFHGRTDDDLGPWLERVGKMRKAGYRMTCTTVYCPPALEAKLLDRGVTVDPPQIRPVPMAGSVVCCLPRVLIAPDGKRYHCVTKLVKQDESGVVSLGGSDAIQCDDATACVACDSLASERRRAK